MWYNQCMKSQSSQQTILDTEAPNLGAGRLEVVVGYVQIFPVMSNLDPCI